MTCSATCGARLAHGKDRLAAFEEKYIPEPNSGCWLWMAACDEHGYGDIWNGREVVAAHRLSYELHIGPIPDEAHILHRCDNPPCVNPEHLFIGDHVINMADMIAKGRNAHGQTHPSAKLSSDDVSFIRSSPMRGRDIAAKFSISESHVSSIRSGNARRNG